MKGSDTQAIDVNVLRDFPDPTPTEDSLRFWQSVESGDLEIQKCTSCARGIFPPRPPLCPYCHGELAWIGVDPAALVYSWVGVDRAIHEWLRAAVPFTVVVVALRDYPDVRIPCYFVGPRGSLAVGKAGTIAFQDVGRTYPLLVFALTEQAE